MFILKSFIADNMQAQPKFILTSEHREICYLLHTHSGIYSVFKNKPCYASQAWWHMRIKSQDSAA